MKDLSFLATKTGKFTIAAFDHRGSLKKMLNPYEPEGVSREEMVAVKSELMRVFGPVVSAVLVDPMYGLGILHQKPRKTGLLLSLEKSGYGGRDFDRLTERLQEWGVDEVKEYGGAAKLLLYYHPDSEHAGRQVELVKRVADECARKGVVFLLELVLFAVEGMSEAELAWARPSVSLELVERFTDWADILKLEFPVDPEVNSDKQDWMRACEAISRQARVPWVLLSRGMEYEVYKKTLGVACRAGASGFAVGRAVWQEIREIVKEDVRRPKMKLDKIKEFLETTGLARMRELVRIVEELGKSWEERS